MILSARWKPSRTETHVSAFVSLDLASSPPDILSFRCPLSGTIEDQQLLLDEERLSNYGTNAARSRESS